MNRIDTSMEGFKYVGINLTEQQYEDLSDLNALIISNEHRKNIPVFNIMVVLKILGLLPEEMLCDNGRDNTACNTYEEIEKSLQCKFGKIKD